MKPKYLTKVGNFRISNLFLETTNRDAILETCERAPPIFTLKSSDFTEAQGSTMLSMQRLFIEAGDVTGYKFAIEVLGSYEHFMLLCEHKIIGAAIDTWKEVVKSKMDSDSIKEIKRIATTGGSQVELSAAKYLANREYEAKGSVGKPAKKSNPRREAAKARETSLDTKAELVRLGLTQH